MSNTFCTSLPAVSIIVLTFNSEATIRTCLDSIFHQDYPAEKLEVIAVDNGSTDGTISILKGYNVSHFIKPKARISELRNFGARQAGGEVLGFIDSDCQVEQGWIGSAIKHLTNRHVGIVGSNYDIPDNANWIEKAWSTNYDTQVKQVNFVPAGNMVLRKDVFDKVKGFDENIDTGEDTDLCERVRKAGYSILSDPKIRSIHWGNPKNLSTFVKKEIWYGKGMVRLLRERNFLNKVLLLTNVFILAHVAVLTALFVPFSINARLCIVFASVFLVVCMSLLSGWYRCHKLNCYKYILPLAFLWYFYFLGRAISLINIYRDFLFRKVSLVRQPIE